MARADDEVNRMRLQLQLDHVGRSAPGRDAMGRDHGRDIGGLGR